MSFPLSVPLPENPVPVVEAWLEEATREAVQRNPNAMTLATADSSGQPSARIVLLKTLAVNEGFAVFYTHYGSRKSVEIKGNARAAAVLHWDRMGKQVRFEGRAVPSPEAESDEYFRTRPWRSQINAWVSEQSRPLEDPSELLERAREKARQLSLPDPLEPSRGKMHAPPPVPRPPFWGGYRLWFAAVELWMEGSHRFHQRLRYERSLVPRDAHTFETGAWTVERLQP